LPGFAGSTTTLPVCKLAGVRKTGGVMSCHTPTSPGEASVGHGMTSVAGGGITTRVIGAVADNAPEVPVTVTVDVARVADPLAVRVITLVVAVEFGLKDAVTPAGRLEAVMPTLPVNPFKSVTVIVVVSDVP
jgi:hypothetical protein